MRRILVLAFATALVLIAIASVGVLAAQASTCTWTGAVNANWSNPGNWSGTAANCTTTGPVSGSTLAFTTATSNQSTYNDFPSGRTYTIKITHSGFTLAGNAIKLGSNISDTDTTGANTISLDMDMTGSTVVTTSAGEILTVSGVIGGAFQFEKSGAGSIILSASNTFTGGFFMKAGSVFVSSDANLGAVPGSYTAGDVTFDGGIVNTTTSFAWNANRGIVISAATVLDPANGTTLTIPTIISSTTTGILTLNNTTTGTAIFSGANTYTGQTKILGGTLSISADDNLGASAKLTFDGGNLETTASFAMVTGRAPTLTSSASIDVAPGTTLTIPGIISGAGTLTQVDSGTMVLSATNTYTGGTTLNGGTLSITTDRNLGKSSAALPCGITFAGGQLVITGPTFTLDAFRGLTFTSNASITIPSGTTVTYGGVASGAGNLVLPGSGRLTLTGTSSTYTGSTTVSGGSLSIAGDGSLGTPPAVATPGFLALNGGATFATTATFALSSNRGIAMPATMTWIPTATTVVTYGGIIAGAGGLTIDGAGTVALSGANTYSGIDTLDAGTLSVGADNNLGAAPGSTTATALTFDGGKLATTGTFSLATKRGMTFTSTATIGVAPATTLSYAGIMTGAGGLTQIDSGTLVLSGSNSYTGTTTTSGGKLEIDGAQGGSAVSVNGGTLQGDGTVGAITTTASGGGVTPGSGSATGILTGGNINWSSGAPAYTVQLNGTTPGSGYTQLSTNGTIDLTGATLSYSGSVSAQPNGTVFTIIKNTGAGGVTGTFTGLAQGAMVSIGSSRFVVSYVGGSGHSVTLTTAAPMLALVDSAPLTGVPGQDLVYTIAFTNNGLQPAVNPIVTSPAPNNTDFKVGSATANLGTTGLSVSIAYSSDSGLTWAYTPTSGGGGAAAGYDRTVTNVQWTFTGTLSQTSPNNAGSVSFTAVIQ